MNKVLKNMIGQAEVKTALSEIIDARQYAKKRKRSFLFPPLNFTGLTGTGKTHFGMAVGDILKSDGFRFEELPIKAGWRFFDSLAQRTCSIDDNTGLAYAIPTIFF